jgi:cell division protein ZapA (FtsZ GTPase activity inhibitor)
VPNSSLRIDLLGTSFSISADEDSAYLESLLNRYRISIENTRKITGLTDPLKLAIMTGFLLCDDIQKLQSHRDFFGPPGIRAEDSEEMERLTLDMVALIDEALDKRK